MVDQYGHRVPADALRQRLDAGQARPSRASPAWVSVHVMACVFAQVVNFGVAFGTSTACTNNFSCTSDRCVPQCDRIGTWFWVITVTLFVVTTAAVLAGRKPVPRRALVGLDLLALLILAGGFEAMTHW